MKAAAWPSAASPDGYDQHRKTMRIEGVERLT
jgi:hypothetical protein